MSVRTIRCWIATAALLVCGSTQVAAGPGREGALSTDVHSLEIVCADVAAQCAALERVHGWSFGPEVADLGMARVAECPDGSLVGARAPLAAHEQPIVRTYLAVDDITKAIADAEAAGAAIAYPPTRQGETGTWAIHGARAKRSRR
jgi:hypothetical protein